MSPVAGQTVINAPDTLYFIQSRFMLWDTYEKMIDSNFTITLVNTNLTSVNNSYKILLNDLAYEGVFNQSVSVNFDLNASYSKIHSMSLFVNDVKLAEFYDIVISRGINQNTINQGSALANLISMSPLEWSQAEWSVFFAVVCGGLFAVLIAYRLVTKYRTARGVRVIK